MIGVWRASVKKGEERYDYPCGFAIVLYLYKDGWRWKVVGTNTPSQLLPAKNKLEARRMAHDGFDTLMRKAINENAAAYMEAGTRPGLVRAVPKEPKP